MALRDDLRKAHSRNGREAPVSGADEHLDHASAKPSRHGAHRNQDAGGNETSGPEPGTDSATRGAGTTNPHGFTAGPFRFRGASVAGLLHQRGGQPRGGGEVWFDDRRRATSCGIRHRRYERRREH